jgi:hypothetical protein
MKRGEFRKEKPLLFLDSGAFSAYQHGVEVDMDAYIEFIKKYESWIDVVASMDVIADPVASYENLKYMEEQGLNPMPVFHTGHEDPKWLKRYIDEGYDYIGLGGMARRGAIRTQLMTMLDDLWRKYLLDSDGMPLVKVHGFGMTSVAIMLRYPWYSCDSASWVVASRHGGVYVPKFRAGEYIYDESPWTISISTRSPYLKEHYKHIDTFPTGARNKILEYFEEKGYPLGRSVFKTVEYEGYEIQENERFFGLVGEDEKVLVEVVEESGASNDCHIRDELNVIYFMDLEEQFQKWPWAFEGDSHKGMKGFGL